MGFSDVDDIVGLATNLVELKVSNNFEYWCPTLLVLLGNVGDQNG